MGESQAYSTLFLIFVCSALMSVVSFAGGITFALSAARLQGLLLLFVAFAAGAMLGGALFHLIPDAVKRYPDSVSAYAGVAIGYAVFFALDLFLTQRPQDVRHSERKPFTYMILVADALHNLIDGVVIGGTLCVDHALGLSVCAASAAHELPHEWGDFAALLHGGWRTSQALIANFICGLAFFAGGLTVYASSRVIDLALLPSLAAGNFIYVAASDLIPEVRQHRRAKHSLNHLAAFVGGLALMLAARVFLERGA